MDAAGLALVLSLGFVAYVLHLIRSGRLREGLALTWLLTGAGMAVLASRRPWLDAIGRFFGVQYPPAFFLLLGLLFTLVMVLNLTVHASRPEERTVRLAQELAVLRRRLEEVEGSHGVRRAVRQRDPAGGGTDPVEAGGHPQRRF
ncbi:MAG TPA: DUF2304 domain-containing protein [Bacillota bacterium]